MSRVTFHKISFKNFLSYGNSETEFVYDSHDNTIITASNGAGKSAMALDTICYALFNKPYRNIKLPQLVNSINNKNLLVSIWFSIGETRYKVIRGQKPSVFEIWKNDELVKEDSNSRDYQSMLETILGFNHKTFKQIVVIGSANYVPFMQLPPATRREVIEEILDISIFSSMQDIAKKKVTEIKSSITSIEYEISLLKDQIQGTKKSIKATEDDIKKAQEDVDQLVLVEQEWQQKLVADIEKYTKSLDELQKLPTDTNEIQKGIRKASNAISTLRNTIHQNEEKIEFFREHENCPQCSQSISQEFRDSVIQAGSVQITETAEKQQSMEDILQKLEKKLEVVEKLNQKITLINNQLITKQSELTSSNKTLSYLLSRKQQVSESGQLNVLNEQLQEQNESLQEKTESKSEFQDILQYYSMAVTMLKDTGIKSRIIANFIPLMNQYINDYLNKFDMFVNFELDETFSETIKSRNRDIFTYESFSQGERQKIDLSILLTWRKIASMKNSISTNIIVFDETLDQSLDAESVDVFMDIIGTLETGVKTIVVSHRSVPPEIFDRHVHIKKINDYSVLST
jgi:DNA repair exonuclease SbcCD ATPase subunit